jgi:phosphoglycerate dehydrogenase-like enzyme
MSLVGAKIGVGSDLFDTNGRPMFGEAPLLVFENAGLAWEMISVKGGKLPRDAFSDYDALLIGGSRVSEAELNDDSGRLRVIARNGVGYDSVDTVALNRRGILLTNTPIPVRHAVATIAVAFMLSLSLRLPLKSRLAREDRWHERGNYPGIGLPGRILGIIGLGGIGQELARLAAPYRMTLLAADPYVSPAVSAKIGVELCSLSELLQRSDFVVVACLLNDTTRHLLNSDRLAEMKPTAHLINVARGPIVDERALIEALQEGRLAGAGLDVFEREPPDSKNPLFAMDNVISTAHCLCWTDTFVDAVARDAISGIVDSMLGRLPNFVVNPEAKKHSRVRSWLKTLP